jgi:hypothetical protein
MKDEHGGTPHPAAAQRMSARRFVLWWFFGGCVIGAFLYEHPIVYMRNVANLIGWCLPFGALGAGLGALWHMLIRRP